MAKRVTKLTIENAWATADKSEVLVHARVPELKYPVRVSWSSGRLMICSFKQETIDPALGKKLAARR
jgi:hypothetical protein